MVDVPSCRCRSSTLSRASLGAALILCASTAAAQRATLRVSADKVEVGQRFRAQLDVLVEVGSPMPTGAALRVPAGLSAEGPSVTPNRQVMIVNGHISQTAGIVAIWTLTATRAGSFTLGPGSALVAGRRAESPKLTVRVVPAGSLPRTQGPSGWPFDVFGLHGGGVTFPGLGDDPVIPEPQVPPELSVDHAPDPSAFLPATLTPSRVVVGEQVTLRVYAYGGRGGFRVINAAEPSRPDFVSFPLMEDTIGEQPFRLTIDEQPWIAVKVREIALYPLHSGELVVGSMSLGFDGRGYPATTPGLGLPRKSPALTVSVREPPLDGRPPGYQLGDVGRYRLTAQVAPRKLKNGESLSVVVKLEGNGNLPAKLKLPQQKAVEWLEPTIAEKTGIDGGGIAGWRSFTYVVRARQAGNVDLGDVELPFWDPQSQSYVVAKATLGHVQVDAGPANAVPTAAPAAGSIEALLDTRKTLGAGPSRPLGLADRSWFWLLLGLGPLTVLGGSGALRTATRIGRELRARRQSGKAVASAALAEARAAAAAGDAGKCAAALERAMFATIEAGTGLRARAVLRDRLEAELIARDVEGKLATDVVGVLAECEALRFAGTAGGSELVKRAAGVVQALARRTPSSAPEIDA